MKGVTGRMMCEHIVKADFLRFKGKDSKAPTADEIWSYSPTGELLMIADWYLEACALLKCDAHGDPFDLNEYFEWMKKQTKHMWSKKPSKQQGGQ